LVVLAVPNIVDLVVSALVRTMGVDVTNKQQQWTVTAGYDAREM
jgi:hypothetical protein